MPISAVASVYEHVNQQGISRYYVVSGEAGYDLATRSSLQAAGLDQAISSVVAYSSTSADTNLILFSWPWAGIRLSDFNGLYLQVTNARSGRELVQNLPELGFNDQATALLLLATNRTAQPELARYSFRDLFQEQWNQTLDAELAGSQARRDGDPVLTWELFPRGDPALDPNSMYLMIGQALRIVLDWWPDYYAWISYHLRLYLDEAHHLQGYVARWGYWVEDGVKREAIEAQLRPKVEAGAETLNARLAEALAPTAGFAFSDLYFLPGRQLRPAPTGVLTGVTSDDVTIVLA
jgi:hypothetical protein